LLESITDTDITVFPAHFGGISGGHMVPIPVPVVTAGFDASE